MRFMLIATIILVSFTKFNKTNADLSDSLEGSYKGQYGYLDKLHERKSQVDANFRIKVTSLGYDKYQVSKLSEGKMPDFQFKVTSVGNVYAISIPIQKSSIGEIRGDGHYQANFNRLNLVFAKYSKYGPEISISLAMVRELQ